MSRFGGGACTGNLDAGPGRGGRRGQEFRKGGYTSPATYYFACNLLLSLPPPAFLNHNNKKKCKEIQLAGGFAFGVQLPSSVSALGGRGGG